MLVVKLGPLTDTLAALLVLHDTVVAPGAVALAGLTEIQPSTLGVATVKLAVTMQLLWMLLSEAPESVALPEVS